MSAYSRVQDLIEIMLHAVSQEVEAHLRREATRSHNLEDRVYSKQPRRLPEVGVPDLSVEIESVITRGALECFKRGGEFTHEKDTEPPPRRSVPPVPRGSLGPPSDTVPPPPKPRRYTPPGPMPTIPPAPPKRKPVTHGQPRPRIPSPVPRTRRDPRFDDDGD